MNQTEQILLQAINKSLWDADISFPADTEWNAVLKAAENQAVFLMVYRAVRNLLSVGIKNSWDSVLYKYTAKNIRVVHAHTYIHELLSQNEIPYVILKGCASARYYSQPVDRIMGDVDFLVEEKKLEQCSMVLKKEGMKRCDDGLHGFHRSFSLNGIGYELHWSPPGIPTEGKGKIQNYLGNVIEDNVLYCNNYVNCYVPNDYHHAMIVLLHNAAHMTTTGIGLRHLCDWTVLVSGLTKENTEKLLIDLNDVGLLTYAKVLTALGTIYLGAPQQSWADIDNRILLEELMEDILTSGNFGTNNASRQNQGAFIRDIKTRKISKQSIIGSFFSTVNRKAKKKHPCLSKHYLSMPIAWCLVCCYYLFQVLSKKRPGFSIKDTIDINSRKKLYDQLKLFE